MPGQGYILFQRAESQHMSVAKMLTGKDLPLSNIEFVLGNTYQLVKHKLQQGQDEGGL